MVSPLRLQSITVTVPDPGRVARFYRWVLQLESAPETRAPGALVLGWGKEDRVGLTSRDGAADAVTLRMPAMDLESVAAWCGERGLEPGAADVGAGDLEAARERWPSARIQPIEDPAAANRTVIALDPPGLPRIELAFPIPARDLAGSGTIGPFTWRSRDWQGLEVPGLLGLTSGSPERSAAREILARLGLSPLEGADDRSGPLAIGDHQWIVEEGDAVQIRGLATVASLKRLRDLERTLEHLKADYRAEGSRLIAADPGGRFVLIHGVHAG